MMAPATGQSSGVPMVPAMPGMPMPSPANFPTRMPMPQPASFHPQRLAPQSIQAQMPAMMAQIPLVATPAAVAGAQQAPGALQFHASAGKSGELSADGMYFLKNRFSGRLSIIAA